MADVNISKYRASVVRDGSKPATPGFVVSEGQDPVDPAGTGQNHLPVTIAPTATGLSITDSQILSGAGTVGQYIRGDGSLADFPSASGGGSSVSYYLNGSVNQGTIGGVAYKELSKVPVLGTGTDFTINANGYIASFITDAGDPNLLEIPGGNWNFETYFSASSSGGTPTFYVELYKYNGTTFTLLASNSGSPELIAFGTTLTSYFSTLAVPTTTLALTDRLAIRYYVNHSGRTITLHTEDNHLCQVITTFTTGLTALNGLTAQVQNFAVGTSGTDFNISSATATHTFNLPTASATNRGALSSADWSTFNAKQNALTLTTTGTSGAATLVGATLNIPQYQAAGTYVNSVTASSPLASSGGVNPNITIQQATATQNGFLSSTDWSTFNSKQNAITLTTTGTSGAATLVGSTLNIPQYQSVLTNPITGTGTTNTVPKFTGTTSIGDSSIQDNASEVSISKRLFLSTGGQSILLTPNLGGASNRIETSSLPLEITTTGSAVRLAAGGVTSQFTLASTGVVTLTNLAGTGTRIVTADASGNLSASSALSGYIQGSGTTNYLPKFTGSTTIGNSNLVDVSGYLVLGGTSSVYGQAGRGTFEMNGSADNILAMRIGGSLAGYLYTNASSMELYSTTILQLSTAGQIRATLSSAGNLILTNGVASDNGERLQVSGNGFFTGSSGTNRVRSTNTASSGFAASAFEMFAHNGSSVVYGGGMFQSNSTLVYQQIAGNQTNIYGFQSGGMRLATGTAPIIFATGNADLDFSQPRMTITSGGNVLIGTTTDNGARLQVSGSIRSGFANTSALLVQSNGTATTGAAIAIQQLTGEGDTIIFGDYEPFAEYGIIARNSLDSIDFTGGTTNGSLDNYNITNRSGNIRTAYVKARIGLGSGITAFGGNVGIGTSSPTTLLQVEGSAPIFTMNRTSGGFINRINFSSGGTNYASIISDAGAGEQRYSIGPSAGWGGYHTFYTDTTERMRITSGGNVGIGTTTDAGFKLNVNGNTYSTTLTLGHVGLNVSDYNFYSQTISGAMGILGHNLRASASVANQVNVVNSGWYSSMIKMYYSEGITFHTSLTSYSAGDVYPMAATERMRITSGGNVLIGTTTDNSHKLRVNGTGYFDTGIKTGNPVGSTTNDWLLGRALVTGTSTPDRWIRVQIGNLYYDILAVYMGSV